MTKWGIHLPKLTRDLILFVVGLGLIIFEGAVRSGEPRTALLALYAAMVGLPFVLRHDERRKDKDNGKE